jgi:NTP pyrophosphatase (non-canonical NTP hydrolase)
MSDALLTFAEYQRRAAETALYPDVGHNLSYPTLGLAGETGEVAEKVKKVLRDQGGVVTESTRAALRQELGDVLWYVAALCRELRLDLGDVAQANLEKLFSRKERGVLHGSGDQR